MDVDWLADVRKFAPDADEGVVAAIVKYCGIALRTEDASKVSFAETKETDRVRENYLKKKLGREESDAELDAAIASTGERMGGGDQNRVSVYYLLADHLGALDTFGGSAGSAGATAAAATAAAAAATTAAAPATAATPTPTPAPIATAMSSGGGAPASPGHSDNRRRKEDDGVFATGCLIGLVALGAIVLSALIAVWVSTAVIPEAPEEPEAPVALAPAPAPAAPAIPEGSGVTATERDGRPMLTVYFDSGSSDVTPDFETVSADLRAYLDANPDSSVQISGYNDPTGNAEINAALSRDRAQNVQAALTGLGLAEERTDLVRPDDTTTTDMTPAEARRVEITIVDG